jgi:hypothetical protein
MNRLWEQFDRSAESLDLPMYGALSPRVSERSRS